MTTDQEKQRAIEDYFRALGWEYSQNVWARLKGEPVFSELPDIIDHFPSFKKLVLEKMEGEGFKLDVNTNIYRIEWFCHPSGKRYGEKTKDNEITLAAVKAATRYWREKNADN